MAKVVVRKSDAEGAYTGTASDFTLEIDKEKGSPRSIDLVLLGLGSCTIGTIAPYLRRKGLPADAVHVELSAEFDEATGAYRDLVVELRFLDSVPAETRKVIASIARTCRIHRTLGSSPDITIKLTDPVPAQ
jgi:uncharacterized OsmC-like protein